MLGYHGNNNKHADDLHNRCWAGRVWFVADVCGVACALITWMLIGYAEYVVLAVVLATWTPPSAATWSRHVHALVYSALSVLALVSHARAMFTDPGAVPRGNATPHALQEAGLADGRMVYKCAKCWSIKPERAHHCSVCQRCIRKMDHHCPWVNNCVGENNQKYFVLFTLYVACISVHALYLGVQQFVTCASRDFQRCGTHEPPTTVIMLLVLVFEGVLFGIFTLIMFVSQVQAIWSDETGIETLQKGRTTSQSALRRRSRWTSLRVVFGRSAYSWLSPFAPPPPHWQSHSASLLFSDNEYGHGRAAHLYAVGSGEKCDLEAPVDCDLAAVSSDDDQSAPNSSILSV